MGKILALVSALLPVLALAGLPATGKMAYWEIQRKGANFFNKEETAQRFRDAKAAGIEVVRLVFNKWTSHLPHAQDGDFLVGSLDDFQALVPEDLAQLSHTLDDAQAAGVKVVISTLSLPGARWRQQNGGKLDSRLWREPRFHQQAASFWQRLASALSGHPAVVGYNLLNEPYPEAAPPRLTDWYSQDYLGWYNKVKSSPSDLNLLYREILAAVRKVDRETPIVLDSGFYATPWAFQYLEVPEDSRVLFDLHMYEPGEYTSYHNEGRYRYPGQVPVGETGTASLDWNRETLRRFFTPVENWRVAHGLTPLRIFAAELGVCRRNAGAAEYLRDLVSIFDEKGWHWAFYSFREDTWTGMDYELGAADLPPEYFAALKEGRDTRQKYYVTNPLWTAIQEGLHRN